MKRKLGPGVIIKGFLIEGVLGEGSMGAVFLATQLSMKRKVALKILTLGMNLEDDSEDRFLNEMRLLGQINHPNIVTAIESGRDHGLYFLAMTLVDGQSLEEKQEKEEIIPEKEGLLITLKIAQALQYVWGKHHILHRDIKPANIMIDKENEVKLTDLGISKDTSSDDNITLTGEVVGTPYYMSPEQAQALPMDHRSDQYSLGATLFHLVTGELPLKGKSIIDTMMMVIDDPIPDPLSINPKLTPATGKIIRRMMAKSPDRRYQEWEELITELKRTLSGKPAKGKTKKPHAQSNAENPPRKRSRKVKKKKNASSAVPIIIIISILACIVLALILAK